VTGAATAGPHCPYEGLKRPGLTWHEGPHRRPHCPYEGLKLHGEVVQRFRVRGPHCPYEGLKRVDLRPVELPADPVLIAPTRD